MAFNLPPNSKSGPTEIRYVESEVGFIINYDEDGEVEEITDEIMKSATILFKDGSKLYLRCYNDECEDKLDAFCISDGCNCFEAYGESGKRINVKKFHSKLLPHFIKRVWQSRKGR